MPALTATIPVVTVLMLTERAADFIKEVRARGESPRVQDTTEPDPLSSTVT